MMYAGDEFYDDDVTSGVALDWDDHLTALEADYNDDEARFEYEIDTVPTFLAAWGEVID